MNIQHMNVSTCTAMIPCDQDNTYSACRLLPESSPWPKASRRKVNSEKINDSVQALLIDLKYCSMKKDLLWGTRLHEKAVESRHESKVCVVTALMKMYAKCGSMIDARRIFDSIQKPNVVCWTSLLMGYAENGEGLATLELFSKMKASGCAPDSVTFVAALKACTSLARRRDGRGQDECLKLGKDIHSQIGCHLNIFVQSTLIDMYGKCGSIVDARRVFENIKTPNVVCWNAMLFGYAENGNGLATLELFSRMMSSGCLPSSITYIAALKACTSLEWNGCLDRGRAIHSQIGCDLDIFVQSSLIDMYSKCGSMLEARQVFESIQNPNVVCWNALLLGYSENGDGHATLELFREMKASGSVPNSVTYIAALKACTSLVGKRDGAGQVECLRWGREIHSEIGLDLDICMCCTLIDMYGKCDRIVDARLVFHSIRRPDVVCWNAMLSAYAENGDGLSTLELFSMMKACGCMPDSVTYVAALKACSLIGALVIGRKLHSCINEFNSHIVTCLVDFYAKCGKMDEACHVFDLHSKARVVPTWNALLAGYGSFGDTDSVFNLFERMHDQGFHPNAVTFVHILSCCSRAGLVEKATEFFEAMPMHYGVSHTIMHYTCIVDVLGRGNQLNEAFAWVHKMPCNPNAATWMTLLGACCKWNNVKIGRRAFQSLMDMDMNNAHAYILMAQIYGSKGMWDEQEKLLLEARIKLGSWEVLGETHVVDDMGNMVKFVAGQKDPPEVKVKLEQLLEGMKEFSYVGKSCSKVAVCGHSERQAVVYGILKIPLREPVRAFKNMRMCGECHGLTKMISKISERVIMLKDASKFHVMSNGTCSCEDYW